MELTKNQICSVKAHEASVLHIIMLDKLTINRKNHLPMVPLKISGEPVEKVLLWGQYSCVFIAGEEHKVPTIYSFGGP
ncbi:hypothetical protein BS78_08G138400 [Paspalum vaginatum]|nr:hypothetical protein BS78_08G138400 [Paspalum vaginatum]